MGEEIPKSGKCYWIGVRFFTGQKFGLLQDICLAKKKKNIVIVTDQVPPELILLTYFFF